MGIASHRPRRGARLLVSSASIGALLAAGVLATGTAGAVGPSAHAARTISIGESGNLTLDNHKGIELKEHGYAAGTLRGLIYLQLRVTSTRSVAAGVQVYITKNDWMSGYASANYQSHGSYASFAGRLNITKGGGRYAKAHGSGLSFTGIVKRTKNDAISVRVSGRLSY